MGDKLYFVQRLDDGQILQLVRIYEDGKGLWSEYLSDGIWIEYPPLLDMVMDPNYGEEITEEEAVKIASLFGGKIEKSKK